MELETHTKSEEVMELETPAKSGEVMELVTRTKSGEVGMKQEAVELVLCLKVPCSDCIRMQADTEMDD